MPTYNGAKRRDERRMNREFDAFESTLATGGRGVLTRIRTSRSWQLAAEGYAHG